MKIIRNSAECLLCNELITSKHRHDFVTCSCGNVSVDGGNAYIRRSVKKDSFEDASIFEVDYKEQPGSLKGMFLVYSPEGDSNPSTVFGRPKEAIETAKQMKETYGGTWYVVGPLSEVA